MRYFENNYKKMIMPTLFLVIIGFVSYNLPLLVQYVGGRLSPNTTGLAAFLIISGLFIPIYEGRVLKNKRGGDMFYSLPLNKTQLNFKIYLKGLIQIVTAFIIIYLFGLIIMLSRGYGFDYINYLPLFFFSLISLIGYYSLNWFAFSKGNSLIDGIIMIAIYNILPLVVFGAALILVTFRFSYRNLSLYLPSSMITNFTKYYFDILTNNQSNMAINLDFVAGVLIPSLIWLAISMGLLIFNLLYTKNIRPEDIEQKSDSYFSYRTLIPLGVFTLSIFFTLGYTVDSQIIGGILIFVLGYIGYVIYQRTFKVKSKYLLLIVGLIVTAIIINMILFNIN